MRRALAACLVALAVLVACADDAPDVAETGTTISTTTSTSEASTTSSTEAAGSTTTTSQPTGVAATAEAAAQGLFGAWTAGDDTAAPDFAEDAAVTALFAEEPAGFSADQFQGCTEVEAGASADCTWTGTDRSLVMRAEGSDADGWRVTGVSFAPAS